MTAIDQDMAARGGIPDLHRPVSAPRGDTLAIGGPDDCIDNKSMAAVHGEAWCTGAAYFPWTLWTGRDTEKVDPFPSSLSTVMVPP
jgi:hypothetical protein